MITEETVLVGTVKVCTVAGVKYPPGVLITVKPHQAEFLIKSEAALPYSEILAMPAMSTVSARKVMGNE